MTSRSTGPAVERSLIEALIETFVATGSVKPSLPQGRRKEVVALLTRLMTNPQLLRHYAAVLEAERRRRGVDDVLYDVKAPELPVEAVAERGLSALGDDLLADLAIRPVALGLLSEYLWESMEYGEVGDFWWEELAQEGHRTQSDYGEQDEVVMPLANAQRGTGKAEGRAVPPAPPTRPVLIILLARPLKHSGGYRRAATSLPSSALEGDEVSDWVLITPAADAAIPLPSEVARRCYDVTSQTVEIRLHRRPSVGAPDSFEPQLEVSPAPVRDALTCTVTFASDLQCELKVPVPRGRPRSAWSEPCEPLPSAAFGREGWELTVAFS